MSHRHQNVVAPSPCHCVIKMSPRLQNVITSSKCQHFIKMSLCHQNVIVSSKCHNVINKMSTLHQKVKRSKRHSHRNFISVVVVYPRFQTSRFFIRRPASVTVRAMIVSSIYLRPSALTVQNSCRPIRASLGPISAFGAPHGHMGAALFLPPLHGSPIKPHAFSGSPLRRQIASCPTERSGTKGSEAASGRSLRYVHLARVSEASDSKRDSFLRR